MTPVADPDPSQVLELLAAFRRSKVMFAALKLGVFDILAKNGHTADEVAEKLTTHPEAQRRLLDACVGLGLLQWDGQKYRNTAAATAYLTQESPQRLTGYLNFSNDVMWGLWAHLDDAVREGTHRWKQVYGWDAPIFSHFFQTPERKREFLMGMHGFGVISSPHVVTAVDLRPFRHLVDLGGATGHLAVAACRQYPQLRAAVFDLPDAVPLAEEMIAATEVADRVSVVGGDFFVDPLPPADLFALGRILHDWAEDKIHQLLQRIYAALPSGGGVLIAEKLLREDKTGPNWAQMQDLNMLTCTEGRERTLAEYTALLEHHGFTRVQGVVTPSPLDAVLAIKA
ncbi:MAG TPA: class I SAM-dependent methyltransferase [Planctomycetaceae bacterium]|nr:class I SAM-dependent methyltransferase [Planctomycetaceae bacterium]